MPRYWMISDREQDDDRLGGDPGPLSYWVSEGGPLDRLSSWKNVGPDRFRTLLVAQANTFPSFGPEDHEKQKHVTLFVHGYNNDWEDAARRYGSLCRLLFSPKGGLGACVLFTWPSDGMAVSYLPDRADARRCAPDLAEVLSMLYDWLAVKQVEGAADAAKACRAKTSIIAHSMGNYLLQNAMQMAWTRKNQPLLLSLVNQLLMVAADVDNDLFECGESSDGSDGDAIANLTYRVTALYSGLDSVLGLSAGMKHFGKRRLGRSGLDRTVPKPDNVWDVDCSPLFPAGQGNIHSAYFEAKKTIALMKAVLQGVDRGVLALRKLAPIG